jgi:hypothetical protein
MSAKPEFVRLRNNRFAIRSGPNNYQVVSKEGPLKSGEWTPVPTISRLRITGTGTLVIDSINRARVVSTNVFTGSYSNTPETIEYPYYGDSAVEARATFPATLNVEII